MTSRPASSAASSSASGVTAITARQWQLAAIGLSDALAPTAARVNSAWQASRAGSALTGAGTSSAAPAGSPRTAAIVRSLDALRKESRRLRDSGAARDRLGVRAAVSMLSVSDAARVAGSVAADGICTPAARSAFNMYRRYIIDNGGNSAATRHPLPITRNKLLAFALYRTIAATALKTGADIKSAGVVTTLTHIRSVACARLVPDAAFDVHALFVWPRAGAGEWRPSLRTQWEISETEWDTIKSQVCGQLAKAVPSSTVATTCLDLGDVRLLYDDAAREWTPESARRWAYISVSIGVQARGTEMSDGLQLGDVHLDTAGARRGVMASVVLHKTNKKSFKPVPRFSPHLPAGFEWLCAQSALLRYLNLCSDWTPSWGRDVVRRHYPVFSTLRHGRCTSTPWGAAAHADVEAACLRVGIARPDRHFGRSTGVLLYKTIGIERDVVARMGSHKEDEHRAFTRYERESLIPLATDTLEHMRRRGIASTCCRGTGTVAAGGSGAARAGDAPRR